MSDDQSATSRRADALANLSPAKRALLEQRLAARGRAASAAHITPRAADAVVPLTPGQRTLWLFDRVASNRNAYNMADVWRVGGELDVAALQIALDAVLERHEALRTTIGGVESDPVLLAQPATRVPFDLHDLSGLESAEREERLDTLVDVVTRRVFDLTRDVLLRAALLRVAEAEWILVIVTHHIAADGWSRGVLLRDLAAAYARARAGEAPGLTPPAVQFADYAVWLAARLDSPELAPHVAYWRERLAAPRPVLELSTDRPREQARTGAGALLRTTWPRELGDRITSFARDQRVTPFMVLLAAWQVVLARHAGQDDVIVGTPVAGRGRPEIEDVVGYFASTVPMRTSLAGDPSFAAVLQQVRATVLDAFEHQDVPLEAMLPADGRSEGNALFRVLFALQNYERAALAMDGLTVTPTPPTDVAARLDLTLGMVERAEGYRLALEYSTELFDRATVERLLARFQTFIRDALSAPERSVSEIDMLPASERALLAEWNATERTWPDAPRTLPEGFAAQLRRTPDAVAVEANGKQLTHAELHAQARALARRLRACGVGPNVTVGVCLERSLELMVALVAVLQAGGAYVPLDSEYPEERLAFMAADAGFPVLLTQSHLRGRVRVPEGTRVIDVVVEAVDDAAAGVTESTATCAPDDLAYMIYTSGSTGQPKGARNTHRAVVNRLLWMQDTYRLTPADVVLQKTPISFDVSVPELFAPLLFGGTVLMADPDGHRDPAYLARTITAHGVTLAHFVPSMLGLFLDESSCAACTTLRHVTCSGEALPFELTKRFLAVLPATRLHNLYGPTEAAVEVSHWECFADAAGPTIPIGRPAANTQLYVLDARQRPVPVGVEGELYIGGVQVGAGYHRRSELTAERFVPDPFRSGVAGARLYRTGDRARWRADGVLEYLGRRDGQIKLRGFRIELGEIENALRRFDTVAAAAVVIRPDRSGNHQLVAYYVPRAEEIARDADLGPVLRTALANVLPTHMVPSAFVRLSALPVMPNGKLDRDALPAPPASETGHAARVEHRTVAESVIADVWSSVLGHTEFGVTSAFFGVGGHSLLAARVVGQVNRIFRGSLTLRGFFDAPTIAGMAEALRASEPKRGQTDAIATLLRKVQSMSPDERARARTGSAPSDSRLADA